MTDIIAITRTTIGTITIIILLVTTIATLTTILTIITVVIITIIATIAVVRSSAWPCKDSMYHSKERQQESAEINTSPHGQDIFPMIHRQP